MVPSQAIYFGPSCAAPKTVPLGRKTGKLGRRRINRLRKVAKEGFLNASDLSRPAVLPRERPKLPRSRQTIRPSTSLVYL